MASSIKIAIPCLNEGTSIGQVIKDFKREVPSAEIYVYDNRSTDKTAEVAQQAGAIIHRVPQRGKGNVLRAIFDTCVADCLVVVDGDGTYSAQDIHQLLNPITSREADMVVGNRLRKANPESLASVRKMGNRIIGSTVNLCFGTQFEDVLSGYRVFNRRFVEQIPLLTPGFETEAELTIQALEQGMEILEIPVEYKARSHDSYSKLRPVSDGWRIMLTIAMLLRDHHPLRIYGLIGGICFLTAVIAAVLKVTNAYGVTQFSDSFLAGLIIVFALIGATLMSVGLVLSAINARFRELKQTLYRKKPM